MNKKPPSLGAVSKTMRRVHEALSRLPTTNIPSIAAECDISVPAARAALELLAEFGYATNWQVGGYYSIAKPKLKQVGKQGKRKGHE